jgi:hypothetical protein
MPQPPSLQIKSKKSDFVVLLIILVSAILMLYMISTFHLKGLIYGESHLKYTQRVEHLLFCTVITLIVFSPIWIYRRKVPKEIHLDAENKTLHIVSKRKNKSLTLPLERISYHYETQALFCNLEIYLTVESSQGHTIKPLTRTIIVPAYGMAINADSLRKMVNCLQENGVEVNRDAKPRSFWDIIAN